MQLCLHVGFWGPRVVEGMRLLLLYLFVSMTAFTTSGIVQLPGPGLGHGDRIVRTFTGHRSAHRCTTGTLALGSLSSLL